MNEFMNPQISVIVPVYNSESTLNRCVDSILSQNFKNFELLLIDDGSTDRSGEICDEYAKKDFRVKVTHKENGGVSSARNAGLDNAKGEWITFVDSDDWIYRDFSFDIVGSHNEDLLIFDYQIDNGESLTPMQAIEHYDVKKMLEKYLCFEIFRTPWAKFFRREIIGNLRFDTRITIGEDTLFSLQYLRNCRSISYSDIAYYVWLKSSVPTNVKYKLNVKEAVYIVSQLYCSYKMLKTRSIEFERFVYEFYRWLCGEDLKQNAKLWYGDKIISSLWNDIKSLYCIKSRILFFLHKNGLSCILLHFKIIHVI